ncbi:MAG: sigma-70 family RNA polymerase sigma factor [Ruminococcus sp.]|nr:sigma-70 family RNA polymerase sigma factor [Ruminococcus sp.]
MTLSELRYIMERSQREGHKALFDEYCNYVYAVIINVLRNIGTREDIEECVSDVFVKIYRSYRDNELREGDLKGFIGAVAKNTAIDYMRKLNSYNRRNTSMDDDDFPEMPSDIRIDADAEKKDSKRLLMQMVESLGEPDSTIIVQQYFYDRTAKEIARSLDMTPAAVQKRSSRAREKLKSLLIKAGIGREAI